MSQIRISNEYLAESEEASRSFISSIESEIEALRAKRLSVSQESGDEELPRAFDTLPSDPTQFPLALDEEGLTLEIDLMVAALPEQEPPAEQEQDFDIKIGELLSQINQRTLNLRQCLEAKKTSYSSMRQPGPSKNTASALEDDVMSQVTTVPCDVSAVTVVAAEEEELVHSGVVQEIVKDLQSKHLAEKAVLEADMRAYRSLVCRLVRKCKGLLRDKQKQEISLALLERVRDQNSQLKAQTLSLGAENLAVASKFAHMKQLLVQFEHERLLQFHEAEAAINQLLQENQNLRSLLTLSLDTYSPVDLQLLAAESEHQSAGPETQPRDDLDDSEPEDEAGASEMPVEVQ